MSKVLVEVDAFTAGITVPEDGDNEDGASVETPFQALANRTLNLDNRVSSVETRLGSGRVVTKMVSLYNGHHLQWNVGISVLGTSVDRTPCIIDLGHLIGNGSILTAVRVGYQQGAVPVSTGAETAVVHVLIDKTVSFSPVDTQLGLADAPMTATQFIMVPAIASPISYSESTSMLYLVVLSSDNASAGADTFHWLEITYTEGAHS